MESLGNYAFGGKTNLRTTKSSFGSRVKSAKPTKPTLSGALRPEL